MVNNELKHHGVLGQKWGVRRYQNKDGTLTVAGKKRKDAEYAQLGRKGRNDYTPNADKWVHQDMERTRNLTNASRNMASDLKTANEKAMRKNAKRKEMDLSNMSDKEMRDAVNRKMLEKQYNDLFNPPTVSKGRQRVDEILDGVGTALTITGSALSIALAIHTLRTGAG